MSLKVIAADDEENALELLCKSINSAIPGSELLAFTDPYQVLHVIEKQRYLPDLAFLDIEMFGITGIEMAKHIKELSPATKIIFVTGYSNYALEAFKVHARGYVLKPVTKDSITEELSQLEVPSKPTKAKIQVCCFGNFEVFIDGKPIKFSYSKTKEFFAYLIDRKGAFCTNGEILSILWEDQFDILKRKSYFRDLKSDLIKTLQAFGCSEIIQKQRGMISVVPEKIDCDYYDWINGKIQAINSYAGEYMRQYSWSEFTLGEIETSPK